MKTIEPGAPVAGTAAPVAGSTATSAEQRKVG
jgi:hypothetical protein